MPKVELRVCVCGHEAEEHDPPPDDAPELYGPCGACDNCEEYSPAPFPAY